MIASRGIVRECGAPAWRSILLLMLAPSSGGPRRELPLQLGTATRAFPFGYFRCPSVTFSTRNRLVVLPEPIAQIKDAGTEGRQKEGGWKERGKYSPKIGESGGRAGRWATGRIYKCGRETSIIICRSAWIHSKGRKTNCRNSKQQKEGIK